MTEEHSKTRRTPSDSTRELLRQKALKRGKSRSEEVERRVRDVMKNIEDDIAANGGVYSKGTGALSSAEIARLAGIHPTTLFSDNQRELGGEVRRWLEALKSGNSVGSARVRRTLKERIAAWQDLYDGLRQSHRDTELELQQTQAELVRARTEIEDLKEENEKLRALIKPSARLNVIGFIKQKRTQDGATKRDSDDSGATD